MICLIIARSLVTATRCIAAWNKGNCIPIENKQPGMMDKSCGRVKCGSFVAQERFPSGGSFWPHLERYIYIWLFNAKIEMNSKSTHAVLTNEIRAICADRKRAGLCIRLDACMLVVSCAFRSRQMTGCPHGSRWSPVRKIMKLWPADHEDLSFPDAAGYSLIGAMGGDDWLCRE